MMHIILIEICHVEDDYLVSCHKSKSEKLCSIPLMYGFGQFLLLSKYAGFLFQIIGTAKSN